MTMSCPVPLLRTAPRLTVNNTASGLTVKPCPGCLRAARDTKATVANGLLLVRLRYGLPYSELPELEVAKLPQFLNFLLLQGKERASVVFPRRQRPPGIDGLCSLQRLCRRDRWALAHSVASIKRNLPAGCRAHTPSSRESWERLAFSSPPPPSHEYLSFVRAETLKLFRVGWDSDYVDFVNRHVPRASARRKLFTRGDLAWVGRGEEFRRQCLSGPDDRGPLTGRYKEVPSTGKCRPLLIFDERVDLLAPLHKMIYRHLAKSTDWLLVGPPTVEKVSSVCRGEFQTSVDLVSATDNLSLPVTEAILGALLSRCVKVHPALRAFAHESMYPVVLSARQERFVGQVSHGQMMGGYLSFPLLCINSYLAARWASRSDRNARFLVNGDDCLISADHEVTDYPDGYCLNGNKTIRAKNVAEVNSTVFLREGGRWRLVRHLRRGGALSDFAGVVHMAKAVSGDVRWTDAFVKSRIGKSWGLTPRQLGLHPRSYPAFCRERTMGIKRIYTPLPSPPVTPEGDLVYKSGRPAPDESFALRCLLFSRGRMKADGRGAAFNPSRGKVRSTFIYRKKVQPSGIKLSYLAHLAFVSVDKGEDKGDPYQVPACYESMEEVRRRFSLVMEDGQMFFVARD